MMMALTNNWIDIEVDRKQMYHYIGYGANYKLPARISPLIDEYMENAHHLIEPSYSYVITGIERVQGCHVVIKGSIVFQSQVIAQLWSSAAKFRCSWRR
jgi:hypothetical protein